MTTSAPNDDDAVVPSAAAAGADAPVPPPSSVTAATIATTTTTTSTATTSTIAAVPASENTNAEAIADAPAATASSSSTGWLVSSWRQAELLPHPDTLVLSVSVGNTHYTWGWHETAPLPSPPSGQQQGQSSSGSNGSNGNQTSDTDPVSDTDDDDTFRLSTPLLWRTSVVETAMYSEYEHDPSELLELFWPPQVLEAVFGIHQVLDPPPPPLPPNHHHNNNNNSNSPNLIENDEEPEYVCATQDALQTSILRRIPTMTLYLVSTNPQHEQGVRFLVRNLPLQIVQLRASDFFSSKQGGYPTLGVDRAASAKAAVALVGAPSLVLDGGTAWTHTCVDSHGNLEGGGIIPGLALQLRSLHTGTGKLPLISPSQIHDLIQDCRDKHDPFPVLTARDTERAMVGGVVSSLTTHVAHIVAHWRDEKRKQPPSPQQSPEAQSQEVQRPVRPNAALRVVVTGGDGPLIFDLLAPSHSNIVPALPTFHGYKLKDDVVHVQYLVHHGIRQLLFEAWDADKQHSHGNSEQQRLRRIRRELLGRRVIRQTMTLPVAGLASGGGAGGGRPTWVRGSVAAIRKGGIGSGAPTATLATDEFRILYDDHTAEDLSIRQLYDALQEYSDRGEACFSDRARQLLSVSQVQDAAERAAALLLREVPDLLHQRPSGESSIRCTLEPTISSPLREVPVLLHQRPTGESSIRGSLETAITGPPIQLAVHSSAGQSLPPSSAHSSRPAKKSRASGVDIGEKITVRIVRSNPTSYVNRRIVKRFENGLWYFGNVRDYVPIESTNESEDLWNILYDDGDTEDLEVNELVACLKHYSRRAHTDRGPPPI